MTEHISLDTPVAQIGHVGNRTAPKLKKLGIITVRDLLYHFPTRYDDYRESTLCGDIDESKIGEIVSVQGIVIRSSSNVGFYRRRLAITNIVIEDETGSLRAVWFNQPYIERQLPVGAIVNLAGKVTRDSRGTYLSNPAYERQNSTTDNLRHTGRFVPKYPETTGITSKYLRFLIPPLLAQLGDIPDPLPAEILEKYDLPTITDALRGIHFPEQLEETEKAKERFALEELLIFQVRAFLDRKHIQSLRAPRIPFEADVVAAFVKSLPFSLTKDQRVAAYEILQDLDRDYPMNRLLNGDVGSGKTIVAFMGAFQTARAHRMTAIMAPTEILARQHFQTAQMLFAQESGIRIGLLTGSGAEQWPTDELTESSISKHLMHEKIERGEYDIVIGTHAVIQKKVQFPNLGLVVIDEQHRFGVSQRMELIKRKGPKNQPIPHLLSMTATPIPRTLALTIYGDLDVSLIKEKPKGRQKIITKIVTADERKRAYKFIENQIEKGRQVFVICPRIDVQEKEEDPAKKGPSVAQLMWQEVRAVTEEYQALSTKIFPHRKVIMLHGKMKATEKDKIMTDFKSRQYDILVSTSVIEVGVDVPNASIMMIESADRFGLAQLHQFRGRVGRGEHQSYCLLFTTGDTEAGKRLKSLEKIESGFELAEMDMKIRGPGEFSGVKQSGVPDLVMASLSDIETIQKARNAARDILATDPTLNLHPQIKDRVLKIQKRVHFE